MNETLKLREYRCRKCHRLFYIDPVERSLLDIDFGCAYGCDDSGEHLRTIRATVNSVDRRVD